jgi:hypothetical protein
MMAIALQEQSAAFLFHHYLRSIEYSPHANEKSAQDLLRVGDASAQFKAHHTLNFPIQEAFTSDPTIIDFMHQIDPTHEFINPAEFFGGLRALGSLPTHAPHFRTVL